MNLSKNPQLIQNFLSSIGLDAVVVELTDSTRTAMEAAEAVNCEVGQIVKSLVFRSGDEALLFLVSGKNQLDTEKVAKIIGRAISKADAGFVKEKTGFAIGGVPPVAHANKIETYIDQDLLDYEEVWAAAGMPHAVFKIKSNDLPRITNGRIIEVNVS